MIDAILQIPKTTIVLGVNVIQGYERCKIVLPGIPRVGEWVALPKDDHEITHKVEMVTYLVRKGVVMISLGIGHSTAEFKFTP